MRLNLFLRRFLGFLTVLVLAFSPAVSAEVNFVFVVPEGPAEKKNVAELKDVPIVQVRGGRAFSFRSLLPGENPRSDSIKSRITKSGAIRKTLELWDLARKKAPAPCQQWISGDSLVPIWVIPKESGGKGLGLISLVPIRIGTGQNFFFASQLLLVGDLKTPKEGVISLEEMMGANLLVPMVCHEIFHGIQSDLMRERFLLLDSFAQGFGMPHDSPLETDPRTAFKEGFAEGGELWLAGLFPGEFYFPKTGNFSMRPEVKSFSSAMCKRRITLASRNRYIFEADGKKKDGRLNSGSSDLATEGVIASLIFTLFGHVKWQNPPREIFAAISNSSPLTLFDLVNQLIKENPSQAPTIRRILLEYTCYTIASSEALSRYENYYLSRKSFLAGKLPRDEYQKIHSMWQDWKAAQLKRIEAGAPLSGAVPQPLVVSNKQGYTLDLHDEDIDRLAWHLEAFFPPGNPDEIRNLSASYAQRIVSKRKEIGVFESIKELEGLVPNWLFLKLQAGFRRYLLKSEKAVDLEISRRRRLFSN
ncbi:hypothetical protein HYY75_11815 [bacterium]|nr:hypothetical protein [bacterium]